MERLEAVQTMSRRTLIVVAAAVAALVVSTAPLAAHHSFAMYDMTVQKTMTGKLVRFVLGGNHSQFVLQLMNPDGKLAVDAAG